MTYATPPTTKGARQAEAILEAAVRCLSRDGYAATSVARIAQEAGVDKRQVLYYFDTRAQLFDRVVRRVGERLLAQVEDAVSGAEDPEDALAVGVERLWRGLTEDRALLVAYYGLVGESVTDERLRERVRRIGDDFRDLIDRLLARALDGGARLVMDEATLRVLIVAGVQGLSLEYLERGDTPALRAAIAEFRRWVAGVVRRGSMVDSTGPAPALDGPAGA